MNAVASPRPALTWRVTTSDTLNRSCGCAMSGSSRHERLRRPLLHRRQILLQLREVRRRPFPPAVVTPREQLVGAPARPPLGQQFGRQVRVQERELAPGVDEQRLLAKARLRRERADASEVLDERLVL